jgi:hypothetical protein
MEMEPRRRTSGLWKRADLTGFSAFSILASNLLVIVFAVVDKLSAVDLLWIYWSQSVIIGLFNVVEILALKEFSTEGFNQGGRPMPPTRAAKISTALFFLFHYGFFHAIYAVFLGTFSRMSDGPSGGGSKSFVLYSAAIFFARYLIDFIRSRAAGREGVPNLGTMMFAPYARIVPMHLTIILGGFVGAIGSFSPGTDLIILVIFAGVKTVVELFTHSVDLSKGAPEPSQG